MKTAISYQPSPDFNNLLTVLQKGCPVRPVLFEFYLNNTLYRQFSDDLPSACPDELLDMLRIISAYKNLGYDYAPVVFHEFFFPANEQHSKASCSMNEGSVISDRETFDSYKWPDPGMAPHYRLEKIAPFIPEGMKLIAWGPGGVLENVTRLVGYENLCFMIMEDETLAADIFDAVGSRFLRYYENVLQYETVGAIISNDDWGFRSQTLLSPEQLRRFVFPWHRKIVEAAHHAGRPAILHSCGQLKEVWEDIICDLKFDGKHSYEDAIQPVEDAYEQYQGRIGILGGLDLDFVCRSEPAVVYQRASAIIERSFERGCYALGTGNSIPEYTPIENYLAMIRAVQEKHKNLI